MTIEQLCEQGKAEWNDVLGRIEVEDDSNVDNLRTFYSCLYRAVLFPRALYEIDAEGKPVQLLGAPDEGEYSGQTRFLTENAIFAGGKAAERVRVGVYEDFTALVLMTDGVSDPVFETEAGLEDTQRWDAMWQGLRGKAGLERPEQGVTEQALADWAGFYSAQDHDDRTIAIFY